MSYGIMECMELTRVVGVYRRTHCARGLRRRWPLARPHRHLVRRGCGRRTRSCSVVADLSGIVPDDVEPRIVRLLDQATDGSVWVLASSDNLAEPTVIVTSSPDETYAPRHDEQLVSPDGSERWIEIADPPDPRIARWVKFAFGVGTVTVESRTVGLDGLRDIAAGLSIEGAELTVPPSWTIAGSYERNVFADGYSTVFSSDADDDSVSIYVDRRDGDRIIGARATGANALVLGPDLEVYELSTNDPGSLVDDVDPIRRIITEFGDNRIVMVNGQLTDDELRQIVSTLREIEPGEFQIYEQPEF